MEKNKFKIIIATGILPPDIGGQATYVLRLTKELEKMGHEVKIVSYGDHQTKSAVADRSEFSPYVVNKNLPLYLKYYKYFKEVKKLSKWADIVYAHDLVSTGLPCSWVKFFRPKLKFVVRLGGDFLWEKAYNNSWTDLPLSQYHNQPKNSKERLYLSIYYFVLNKIDKIIFSTKWQSHIYDKYFHTGSKSVVIENAFPKSDDDLKNKKSNNKNIIFAGRLIRLKNLSRVIEALRDSCDVKFNIIGNGPEKEHLEKEIKQLSLESKVSVRSGVSSEKLDQYIADSFLVIVPSISEVSPNIVLECIRLGRPLLLTKECGFYNQYKDDLVFIDPFSIADIREKICGLLDENEYNKYLRRIANIDISRNWRTLAEEHIELFKKL